MNQQGPSIPQHTRLLSAIALVAFLTAGLLTAVSGASFWEIRWVQAVQNNAALKVLMQLITFLGDERFFLLLAPLFFWCVDKALGIDLALLLISSAFANGLLKGFFKHPRPFWNDPGLRLSDADTFSLPSGHSQGVTVLAGRVGQTVNATGWPRRSRVAILCILVALVALVAVSRVYLGVHFLGDVIWGVVVGLGVLALYSELRPRLAGRLATLSLRGHVLSAIGAAALIVLLNRAVLAIPFGHGTSFGEFYAEAYRSTLAENANLAGMVLGLWAGLALEARYVQFVVAGPNWKRAARYLVGIGGLFGAWMGLRVLFPQEPLTLGLALRVLRYSLTFLWAIAIWPWIFVRVRL